MFNKGGFNWAPRIATIRGMDIRLHLSLVLITAVLVLSNGMSVPGLTHGLVLVVALYAVILWHELGHAWAARRSGLHVHGIVLWPLGGECQIVGSMPSPRADLFVSLAGPGAHALLVAVTAVPALLLLPSLHGAINPMGAAAGAAGALAGAWGLAVYILIFNLIPAFPLDGGRALRALLTRRMDDVTATVVAVRVGQAFAAVYLVLGLFGGGMLLIFLAVYIFTGAENELRRVKYVGYVYEGGRGRSYFSALGVKEDWSREAVEGYGKPGKPGFFARWKTNRRLRKLARQEARREKLRAEVDRILDKVNREGMTALTAKERRILKEASGEYRKQ